MKPIPDISNDAAMLLRGRRSAISAARNDAASTLRDACTLTQSADWGDLRTHLAAIDVARERLLTLAAMWEELQ